MEAGWAAGLPGPTESGPAGEISESAMTFVIPVDQLHEGEWQYATGGGRCALQQCDALGLRQPVRTLNALQPMSVERSPHE